MLLTSVIIVLREVLEAALLVSILLALSRVLGISRRWVGWSLGAGMAGACIYSLGVAAISDWFDGVGQEVTSAALQFLVYLLLLLFTLLLLRASGARRLPEKLTMLIMAATVSLAITREGFEVLVYIYGFSSVLPQFVTILMGSAIGATARSHGRAGYDLRDQSGWYWGLPDHPGGHRRSRERGYHRVD